MNALLQSGLAVLENKGQRMRVRFLFDSGSNRSYVRKGITEALGLKKIGPPEALTVTTLGAKSIADTYSKTQFDLVSQFNQNNRITMSALCLDRICGPPEPVDESIINQPYLDGLQIADNYP
jgi:hypothetical protein